jgi:hypothetical protein
VSSGLASSSDDQKSHIRDDIEHQKNDFEQAEKRVNNDVPGFPGNREPYALYSVHEIRGKYEEHCPQNQDATIDDGAPHEERCECLNIHDVFLYPFLHPATTGLPDGRVLFPAMYLFPELPIISGRTP